MMRGIFGLAWGTLACGCALVGCTGSVDPTGGGSSAGGSGGSDAAGGSGGSDAAGGSGGSDAAGGSGGSFPPGPPGCGLAQAAFCDPFDAPSRSATRAGELAGKKWSAARMCNIGGPSADGEAVAIGPATLKTCRSGLPSTILPSSDALICDGTPAIHSNHLLVLSAAQNYGQNSYRIRQPFDFKDRTGSIVFDAEGHNVGLQGWISIEITEDPTPAPSFTLQQNFENGAVPRNGIEIQFGGICGGDNVGITQLFEYDDFAQNVVLSDGPCAPAAAGKLNHFEVRLSTSRVEVFATPASNDGVTFGSPISLGSANISLAFSRGYMHFTTHNHATLKYSDGKIDAWTARWDNIGFDGPAITSGFREYEALDSLSPANGGKLNVGWRLPDAAAGPPAAIEIKNVDPAGAVRARLALENWSYHTPGSAALTSYALNYSLNGHTWKARKLTASELRMMATLDNAGTRSLMLDVDVADLVPGTNKLELTTSGATKDPYPPVALNIDLLLETN